MKRSIILMVFLLLMTGCSSKGDEGEKCLTDGKCSSPNLACNTQNRCAECGDTFEICCDNNTCLNEGEVCGQGGYCDRCGYEDYACCPGDSCREGNICGQDDVCSACGLEGSPCCPGDQCDEYSVCSPDGFCESCGTEIGSRCCEEGGIACQAGACDPAGFCVNEICESDENCSACGAFGEPCCEGNSCEEGRVCNDDLTCDFCGGDDELPCEGGECFGWYSLLDGRCRNSFAYDRNSDLSICRNIQKSSPSDLAQDWCFWNASYYKKDKSICDEIEWSEMIDLCVEGENPANYTAYITYE